MLSLLIQYYFYKHFDLTFTTHHALGVHFHIKSSLLIIWPFLQCPAKCFFLALVWIEIGVLTKTSNVMRLILEHNQSTQWTRFFFSPALRIQDVIGKLSVTSSFEKISKRLQGFKAVFDENEKTFLGKLKMAPSATLKCVMEHHILLAFLEKHLHHLLLHQKSVKNVVAVLYFVPNKIHPIFKNRKTWKNKSLDFVNRSLIFPLWYGFRDTIQKYQHFVHSTLKTERRIW